jgi:SAM-dependent methyltransferase
MKLSQIVAFKNYLESITPIDATRLVYENLGNVLHSIQSRDVQFDNLTRLLEHNYQMVIKNVNKFEQSIESIKIELDQAIAQFEPNYYAESFRIYSQEMIYDTPEYILNRRFDLTESSIEHITSRLKAHGNWKHAGLIIRPGREDWINYLVGCDPLYLVDQHAELLEPAVLRFNDQYQRRLRTYTIQESANSEILNAIPNCQFAFCLVYNFFNYKPIELVRIYLSEIYNKLKPGGTLAITFNDCDREGGVRLAEHNFMCYTPGHVILDYAKELGFEIREIFRMDSATTWTEFRRPGKLHSIKGGQSLAKILYKTTESLYTTEEIQKFRQQALDLNIVHPTKIDQVPLAQLIHEIKQRIKQ